jgi:hypothetical protein
MRAPGPALQVCFSVPSRAEPSFGGASCLPQLRAAPAVNCREVNGLEVHPTVDSIGWGLGKLFTNFVGCNFHPHARAITSDGVFTPEGEFLSLPSLDTSAVLEVFRRLLLRRLHKEDFRGGLPIVPLWGADEDCLHDYGSAHRRSHPATPRKPALPGSGSFRAPRPTQQFAGSPHFLCQHPQPTSIPQAAFALFPR